LATIVDRYCRLLEFLCVACLAAMVVMVFGNVTLRYLFNSGVTVSEELSRWLFVWMTFSGAIVAVRERGHLGTEALISRLPDLARKACYAVSHVLMIAICVLVFKGAWEQTKINRTTTSAVMEASMAFFYACGLLFAASAALFLAANLVRLARGQVPEAELSGMPESEDTARSSAGERR
jgi:TRAP-type C4-dicarboxylate transport system permease small subunit